MTIEESIAEIRLVVTELQENLAANVAVTASLARVTQQIHARLSWYETRVPVIHEEFLNLERFKASTEEQLGEDSRQ